MTRARPLAALLLLVIGAAVAAAAQDTLPIGFGTLRRDDIVLGFATDQLELQILPLNQQVIRLLAPDTYRSLAQLIRSKDSLITDAARRAGLTATTLVLVTFFGKASGARFVPEDVTITSRGRQFRPLGFVPLSPTWNTQQLDLRQQAVAIYLYEDGIGWYEDLTVGYQSFSNAGWGHSMRLLQQERSRVLARAQSQPAASVPPPR